MKTKALILAALIPITGLFAESAPTEVTLSSGATLRGVSIVKWKDRETVILKHAGGIDPVQLRHLTPDSRAQLEEVRDSTPRKKAAAPEALTVRGEVFVATRGAGAYKFANALVLAFPLEQRREFVERVRWVLPQHTAVSIEEQDTRVYQAVQQVADEWRDRQVAATRTNSEGQFEFAAPGPVFVVCTTSRHFGRRNELNTWVLPAPEGPMLLTNTNQLVIER